MKKIASLLLLNLGLLSTAFADIIYTPRPEPKPVPAPEPEDDGEVVVIKTLLIMGMLVTMGIMMYMKNKKSKVKEY
ncbi:MAG: hypothetical protein IKR04_01165 [Clostridia bacterium]|nr:hypothetical protein [Clostridia bacterium]